MKYMEIPRCHGKSVAMHYQRAALIDAIRKRSPESLTPEMLELEKYYKYLIENNKTLANFSYEQWRKDHG